jgi:CTP:molybdopterin cytidylyltransferase MocA/SAM-dependent methyltransferase
VAAIVLAAGRGTRFGGRKLLASVDGRPLLQHVLDRVAGAGIDDVVVVLGDDAEALEAAIQWRGERRIRNEDPGRGLSSSLRIGIEALDDRVAAALIVLGDQPRVPLRAISALLAAGVDDDRPITVPRYVGDEGRNPVLLGRAAFGSIEGIAGDRGLGPLISAHPGLVREIPIDADDGTDNPDVDTAADLVAVLEAAWADRVLANKDQVDRIREVPDATDFYAPVTSLFRADPTRTDEPALASLLAMVEPGDTWLDIGAGAGRYALPIARAVADSGGEVIAVDPSHGMLTSLIAIAAEYGITNVRTAELRWPPADGDVSSYAADVSLIAHVSYDIAAIGPFVAAMEAAARRSCVAVLMERQPSSIADVCWPPTWAESRIALPALPEFLELLRARGRAPSVERLEREPRRFGSRDELVGFLRRQLWVEEGSAADARFLAALEPMLVTDGEGRVGLQGQRPLPIGIVTWDPRGPG